MRVLIRDVNFLQQSRVDTLVLPKARPLWIMQQARWVLDRISCFVPVSCFITCGCRVTMPFEGLTLSGLGWHYHFVYDIFWITKTMICNSEFPTFCKRLKTIFVSSTGGKTNVINEWRRGKRVLFGKCNFYICDTNCKQMNQHIFISYWIIRLTCLRMFLSCKK